MSYQELKSYQQATIIYDITVEFCRLYIRPGSRTRDQMEQAARSGKQNIVEGTKASKTWPQTEVKLLGVARASLEELLEDYKDFLRQKGLPLWGKDDPRAVAVRRLAYENRSDMSDRSNRTDMSDRTDRTDRTDRSDGSGVTYSPYSTYQTYRSYLNDPEAIANTMITLISQTTYLLDQQIKAVDAQHRGRGEIMESHQQKLARLLAERTKKEKDFDEWLKQFRDKEK